MPAIKITVAAGLFIVGWRRFPSLILLHGLSILYSKDTLVKQQYSAMIDLILPVYHSKAMARSFARQALSRLILNTSCNYVDLYSRLHSAKKFIQCHGLLLLLLISVACWIMQYFMFKAFGG